MKKPSLKKCSWISHLFYTVVWLSLLEKDLKHFKYFQPGLVLQESSTNSIHPFHVENSTETQVFLIPVISALLQGMDSRSEVSYSSFLFPFIQTDKSKHLAVCNGRVEQNWKWISSYMQDWGDWKMRRLGLEPWTCIFFYLYLKIDILF